MWRSTANTELNSELSRNTSGNCVIENKTRHSNCVTFPLVQKAQQHMLIRPKEVLDTRPHGGSITEDQCWKCWLLSNKADSRTQGRVTWSGSKLENNHRNLAGKLATCVLLHVTQDQAWHRDIKSHGSGKVLPGEKRESHLLSKVQYSEFYIQISRSGQRMNAWIHWRVGAQSPEQELSS